MYTLECVFTSWVGERCFYYYGKKERPVFLLLPPKGTLNSLFNSVYNCSLAVLGLIYLRKSISHIKFLDPKQKCMETMSLIYISSLGWRRYGRIMASSAKGYGRNLKWVGSYLWKYCQLNINCQHFVITISLSKGF